MKYMRMAGDYEVKAPGKLLRRAGDAEADRAELAIGVLAVDLAVVIVVRAVLTPGLDRGDEEPEVADVVAAIARDHDQQLLACLELSGEFGGEVA